MSSPAEPRADSHLEPRDDELTLLRVQIGELRDALEAIRRGGIDAVIAGPPGEEAVYTLASADRPYRVILEEMNEGALTVSPSGIVLFANTRLAGLLDRPVESIIGEHLSEVVTADDRPALAGLLALGPGEHGRAEVRLAGPDRLVPVVLAASGLAIEEATVVCVIATDLTSQKQIEATLRLNQQQLDARARELELLNTGLEEIVAARTAELTSAVHQLEREAAARQQWARELNDTIVQTLVAAETNADLGHPEQSRRLLHTATRAVRDRVTQLLEEGGPIQPGSLVRTQPAEQAHAHTQAVTS